MLIRAFHRCAFATRATQADTMALPSSWNGGRSRGAAMTHAVRLLALFVALVISCAPTSVHAAVDGCVVCTCPDDMVTVPARNGMPSFCMDTYEAPNKYAELPLVQFSYLEAVDWCEARGKRLCFDDEFTLVCEGDNKYTYPYGNVWQPGDCNDNKVWKVYSSSTLALWQDGWSSPDIETLQQLLDKAAATGADGQLVADHVWDLYQGDPAGTHDALCSGDFGVPDAFGSIEEWTTRRDGGTQDFHGNLKGRYWAEARTCQGSVTSHGDPFRFYEIGHRCCRDLCPGNTPTTDCGKAYSGGTCIDSVAEDCDGELHTGLCSGEGAECCAPSQCQLEGGYCQTDTLACGVAYESNLCPGAADHRCCKDGANDATATDDSTLECPGTSTTTDTGPPDTSSDGGGGDSSSSTDPSTSGGGGGSAADGPTRSDEESLVGMAAAGALVGLFGAACVVGVGALFLRRKWNASDGDKLAAEMFNDNTPRF